MKNFIFWTVISVLVFMATGCQSQKMAGATIASQTFCFPETSALRNAGLVTVDNAYLILVDISNADMIHAATGAVTTAWGTDGTDGAAIPVAADGQMVEFGCATIPALDNTKQYAMCLLENGTPANTDEILAVWLYDPTTNKTFTDTNPIFGKRIRIIDY